jgi:hypothetical protein
MREVIFYAQRRGKKQQSTHPSRKDEKMLKNTYGNLINGLLAAFFAFLWTLLLSSVSPVCAK